MQKYFANTRKKTLYIKSKILAQFISIKYSNGMMQNIKYILFLSDKNK